MRKLLVLGLFPAVFGMELTEIDLLKQSMQSMRQSMRDMQAVIDAIGKKKVLLSDAGTQTDLTNLSEDVAGQMFKKPEIKLPLKEEGEIKVSEESSSFVVFDTIKAFLRNVDNEQVKILLKKSVTDRPEGGPGRTFYRVKGLQDFRWSEYDDFLLLLTKKCKKAEKDYSDFCLSVKKNEVDRRNLTNIWPIAGNGYSHSYESTSFDIFFHKKESLEFLVAAIKNFFDSFSELCRAKGDFKKEMQKKILESDSPRRACCVSGSHVLFELAWHVKEETLSIIVPWENEAFILQEEREKKAETERKQRIKELMQKEGLLNNAY